MTSDDITDTILGGYWLKITAEFFKNYLGAAGISAAGIAGAAGALCSAAGALCSAAGFAFWQLICLQAGSNNANISAIANIFFIMFLFLKK